MEKAIIKGAAALAASLLVTACLWMLMTAVASFVALDWRPITASLGGRFGFAVIWLWLHQKLGEAVKEEWDA